MNLTDNAMQLLSSKNEGSKMLGAEMLFYQGEYKDFFTWVERRAAKSKYNEFALKFMGVKFMQYYRGTVTVYRSVTTTHGSFNTTNHKPSNPSNFSKNGLKTEAHKLQIIQNIAEIICNLLEDIRELKNL